MHLEIPGNSGEIWIPKASDRKKYTPVKDLVKETGSGSRKAGGAGSGKPKNTPQPKMPQRAAVPKPYEEMTIEELQAEILAKMAANGPVTDRMKQDVLENVYPNSLLNWVRSFR